MRTALRAGGHRSGKQRPDQTLDFRMAKWMNIMPRIIMLTRIMSD
jgi:hypothetical protein